MLPARDRITALYVYSSKADALANTGGTEYTEGIVDGTPRLERVFFNALPAFGECNAAMFECELNINVNLKGKWIRVATKAYASDAATTRTTYWLFCGLVDSCKYDARQATRSLVAYDEMYTLRNTDVSDWWNTYFSTVSGNPAMGTVLSEMMAAFGVTGTAATTVGTSYVVFTSAQRQHLFSGCSFAQMLSYIGTAQRMSFYINENGALTACNYANVNKSNTPIALDANVDTVQSTFGDDANSEYSNILIYDGTEVAYSDGANPPTYAVNDNPLLKGRNASQYASIGTIDFAAAKKMSGLRNATIELIVSSPDVVLSRPVAVSYNGVTYMASGIVLYGNQLINQTISCTNEMSDSPYYASSITTTSIVDGAITGDKIAGGAVGTAKLAESAVTEGKIAANAVTENKIVANAVVAEKIASGAVSTDKLAALAVTAAKIAAGAVTADKIQAGAVTANKIDVEDLESLNATIGGWTINETNIAASGDSIKLNSAGSVEVTETGSSAAASAKYVATGQYDDKAYYSAYGISLNNRDSSRRSWHYSNEFAFYENESTSGGHNEHRLTIDAQNITNSRDKYTGSSLTEQRRTVLTPTALQCEDGANIKALYARSGAYVYNTSGVTVTKLSETELTINTHNLLRMTPHLAQMFATAISANADLNTETYLAVGQYFCAANATAQTYSNCPTTYAFTMIVESPISSAYDEESGVNFYRVRTITDHYGNVWTQSAVRNGSTVTYRAWQRDIRSTEFTEVTSGTVRKATTTTLSDTDVSITIPTAGYWIFFATINYNNARPQQIAVCALSGNYIQQKAFSEAQTYDKTVSQITATGMYYLAANTVLKVYAKCATAHATGNDVFIYAKKIP